jgi:hypothetical protein
LSAAATVPRTQPGESTLDVYRDDGPLSRALGRLLGAQLPAAPVALVTAGALPLFAAIAIAGSGASDALVAATVGWLVLTAGASSGRPQADRLRWAAIPVLRAAEYAAVLWIGALAGGSGPAAAFALLAAVSFQHYNLVYRLRYQGTPPRWLGDFAGGWEGRLVVAWVLLAADVVPAGFFAIAIALGLLFVGESAYSWARVRRADSIVEYEDEEAGEE